VIYEKFFNTRIFYYEEFYVMARRDATIAKLGKLSISSSILGPCIVLAKVALLSITSYLAVSNIDCASSGFNIGPVSINLYPGSTLKSI